MAPPIFEGVCAHQNRSGAWDSAQHCIGHVSRRRHAPPRSAKAHDIPSSPCLSPNTRPQPMRCRRAGLAPAAFKAPAGVSKRDASSMKCALVQQAGTRPALQEDVLRPVATCVAPTRKAIGPCFHKKATGPLWERRESRQMRPVSTQTPGTHGRCRPAKRRNTAPVCVRPRSRRSPPPRSTG